MAFTDKIPPQNIEAEKSVLGSMLIEQEAIGRVIELLKDDSFYKDNHRKIFSVIVELFFNNQPIDIITVSEYLKKRNELEAVGGTEYISELINTVPTAANVEYYANIVKEKASLRDVINVCTNIVTEAFQDNVIADDLLDKAENNIFRISEKRIKPGFKLMRQLVHPTMEKIESLAQRQTLVTGVATSFDKLDEMTTGLHGGELIIVAARPGMGKTALCLSIAQAAAIRNKVPIALFSLEMSTEQLVLRMLSSEAKVDMHRIRAGKIYDADWPRLTEAASRLSEAPIYIDDSSSLSILEIKAKTRRWKSENRIKDGEGLVVVDYLQMMEGKSAENRQQEITQISRGLKMLAKELDVPVMVASQLSRAPEKSDRGDKRPSISHLRESGAIEQDADCVLLIYRESYYNRELESKAETEIIIGKQRNGPIGTIKIAFLEQFARFENLVFTPELPPGEEVIDTGI